MIGLKGGILLNSVHLLGSCVCFMILINIQMIEYLSLMQDVVVIGQKLKEEGVGVILIGCHSPNPQKIMPVSSVGRCNSLLKNRSAVRVLHRQK